MTTSVLVNCPEGATWDVLVEIKEGEEVKETMTLRPGASQYFAIWGEKSLHIKEVEMLVPTPDGG